MGRLSYSGRDSYHQEPTVKKRLYRLLEPEPPFEHWWSRAVDYFILVMILLSAGSVILTTVDSVASE